MKKIPIITLVLAAGFTSSCKKCQTCTTAVETNTVGVVTSTSADVEYCGDEYDNAPEDASVTVDVGGGVSTTTSITCVDS